MLERDKQLHFEVGAAIAFFTGIFFAAPIAVGAAFAAAVGKETYDYFHQDKHTPDWADIVWTVLGGGFGAFLAEVAVNTFK